MIFAIIGVVVACTGFWLLHRKGVWKRCPPLAASSADAIAYLKPGKNQAREKERVWKSKIRIGLYVLLAGSVLLLTEKVFWSEEAKEVTKLERPEPGQGDIDISLSAWLGEDEIPVDVEISERVPGKEEAEKAIEASYHLLTERILGENPSLGAVSYDLYLPTYLEETACEVYWYIDNTERIDRNGIVNTEGISGAEQVNLTAEISIGPYEKEYVFSVLVVQGEMNEREKLIYDIKQEIKKASKEGEQENSIVLPQIVGGKEIVYKEPSNDQTGLFVVLIILLAVCSTFLPEQKLAQEKKEKEKELMLAYPEIVSKLCLLIGSGLTVRRAWERIIQEYKERRVKNYAYEEMLFSYYELERGLPEGKVYAAFGKRCRLHGYRKLGSLLEQNLKKGTAGLVALLQEETWQAFEDRRAFAVKLAQEAGTRMLLPMILLLLVVLVICIAPAVMSF